MAAGSEKKPLLASLECCIGLLHTSACALSPSAHTFSCSTVLPFFSSLPYYALPQAMTRIWPCLYFSVPYTSFSCPLSSAPAFSLVASEHFTALFFLSTHISYPTLLFDSLDSLPFCCACSFLAQGPSVTRSPITLWICRHFLELLYASSHHIL